jgi:hypothetical protein
MPFFILAGAALLGSGISALGASSAASTQANAADQASAVQLQMFNQTQANEAPYLAAGGNALAALLKGEGLGAGTNGSGTGPLNAPFNPGDLTKTPGYQFTLQQGEQAMLDQQSAVGGVAGGNSLKALTGYAEGLANTTYQQQLQDYMAQQQQQFGQLQTIAGSGQNAAANLGALSGQAATNIGNNIIGAGNASAAGTIGVTNALTGGISSLGSNYLLASLLGGGGGGFSTGSIPGDF